MGWLLRKQDLFLPHSLYKVSNYLCLIFGIVAVMFDLWCSNTLCYVAVQRTQSVTCAVYTFFTLCYLYLICAFRICSELVSCRLLRNLLRWRKIWHLNRTRCRSPRLRHQALLVVSMMLEMRSFQTLTNSTCFVCFLWHRLP